MLLDSLETDAGGVELHSRKYHAQYRRPFEASGPDPHASRLGCAGGEVIWALTW
jgi:hypothetical protein